MSVLERLSFRNQLFQKHNKGEVLDSSTEFSIKLRKSRRNSDLLKKRRNFSQVFKEFPSDLKSFAPFLFTLDLNLELKIQKLDQLIVPENKKFFPSIVQGLLNLEGLYENNIKLGTLLNNFFDMAFDELLNLDSPIKSHLVKLVGRLAYEDDVSKFKEKHLMILVKLLNSRVYAKDFETLVVILGNLACDIEKRDLILRLEAFKVIFKAIDERKLEIGSMANVLWVLAALLKGFPPAPLFYIKAYIDLTADLLRTSSDDDLVEILWGYSYILEHSKLVNFILDIIDFDYFCTLALREKLEIPSIRCIGFILYHNPGYAKDLMTSGLAQYFMTRFDNLSQDLKMDIIWVLLIFSDLGQDYCKFLARLPSFGFVCLASNSIDELIKKSTLELIYSCMKGLDYVESVNLFSLVPGLFDNIVSNLESSSSFNIVLSIQVIYKLFENEQELEMLTGRKREFYLSFEDCEGLSSLEKLQYHDSDEVYLESKGIIQRFWEYE